MPVVIGLSVVLSEGGGWGWTSARSLGILAASCLLLAIWIPYELRFADPLVDLRQVRHRSVLTADVSGFFISVAMYILLPSLVVFVQVPVAQGYGFGASIVVSGLVLVPLSVCSFLASQLLGVYERRFGARSMIPLGSMVFAVSAAFFALEHRALWEAFVTAALSGLALGFTTGAMPGFIVRAVARSETGSATGFYQVVRSIGLTLGSAVSAAVLMAHTRTGTDPARCRRLSGHAPDRRRNLRRHRGHQLRAARAGRRTGVRSHAPTNGKSSKRS